MSPAPPTHPTLPHPGTDLQDGQRKGARLAAACLCQANHILVCATERGQGRQQVTTFATRLRFEYAVVATQSSTLGLLLKQLCAYFPCFLASCNNLLAYPAAPAALPAPE